MLRKFNYVSILSIALIPRACNGSNYPTMFQCLDLTTEAASSSTLSSPVTIWSPSCRASKEAWHSSSLVSNIYRVARKKVADFPRS